jgi:hypothetical protein
MPSRSAFQDPPRVTTVPLPRTQGTTTMSAIAPFAASSFAPEERPQQLPAGQTRPRRTGRHEPIRSSTSRLAARGAALGITMAAGMAFVGAWTERRRMTRVARAAAGPAVRLAAGTPRPAAPSASWAGSPCSAPCCGAD